MITVNDIAKDNPNDEVLKEMLQIMTEDELNDILQADELDIIIDREPITETAEEVKDRYEAMFEEVKAHRGGTL